VKLQQAAVGNVRQLIKAEKKNTGTESVEGVVREKDRLDSQGAQWTYFRQGNSGRVVATSVWT
jgi:hypothetical protein